MLTVMTVLSLMARALVPARRRDDRRRPPGSAGEHALQERFGTEQRAQQFYRNQVAGQLTPVMAEFIGRMEMAFIATSDADGECDCSFRAGPAGFIRVLDEATIAYPEYRGNGVMASLGNMLVNPHIGIFLVDFTRDLIGLHVNGEASIITHAQMQELDPDRPEPQTPGRRPVQWVLITVTEAYIHCSKHIPLLVPQSRIRHWGTDNPRHKGGNYFGVTPAEPAPSRGRERRQLPVGDAARRAPLPGKEVGEPLELLVHGRRDAVLPAEQDDLPVQVVGLDGSGAAGQALPG